MISSRQHVEVRLKGEIPKLLLLMRLLFRESQSTGDTSALASSLRKLKLLLQDTDCALQCGFDGGHQLISRLAIEGGGGERGGGGKGGDEKSGRDDDITEARVASKTEEEEEEDDEIVSLASECIATCTAMLPPGIGFPMQPAIGLSPPGPLRFNFSACIDLAPVDGDLFAGTWLDVGGGAGGGGAPEGASGSSSSSSSSSSNSSSSSSTLAETTSKSSAEVIETVEAAAAAAVVIEKEATNIWTRAIPPWIHRQTSQDDVGQVLWPAAIPFSRWIIAHRNLLFQKRHICKQQQQHHLITTTLPTLTTSTTVFPLVLEIGSGMGLCGIVAALMKAAVSSFSTSSSSSVLSPSWPVVLSDFNAVVLHNLHYNSLLNEPTRNPEAFPALVAKMQQLHEEHSSSSTKNAENLLLMRTALVDWSGLWEKLTSENPVLATTASTITTISSSSAAAAQAEHGDYKATKGMQNEEEEEVNNADEVNNESVSIQPLPMNKVFDLILASDMICSEKDAQGVAALLHERLAYPHGVAVFMLAPSDVRWGVEFLQPSLTRLGLCVQSRTVNPCFVNPSSSNGSSSSSSKKNTTTSTDDNDNDDDGDRDTTTTTTTAAVVQQEEIHKPDDLPDVVIAGGYESHLQLHVVTWGAKECLESGPADIPARAGSDTDA